MRELTIASAIQVAQSELLVEIARTPSSVHEAHQLRHQVYCLERGYEAGQNDIEIDEFDRYSQHVLLRKRASGEVIGTARLILPRIKRPFDCFPMHQVCDRDQFNGLPTRTIAEVSRFAISKERRGLSMESTSLSRLALVQGLVLLSKQVGVTHWCAMMERTLLRLLRASAIHFTPIGPAIEYHGLRQPAVCEVASMLDRMRDEQPEIWGFIAGRAQAANQDAWQQAGQRQAA